MRTRTTAPVMIVLLAVLAYSAREQLILPFAPPVARVELTEAIEGPRTPEESRVGAPVDESPTPGPVEGTIRKNSSLYVELTDAGVTPADVERVVRDSRKTYNLRRVRPGQEFSAYISATGKLDSLEFGISYL
ncbi:MAG: hypothetical protein IH969_08100, partial [Candidatus Krumholzibacteriota bacterium]|nr:hypothetical protein [Candidatus Krumholzibacteriota bacterium]